MHRLMAATVLSLALASPALAQTTTAPAPAPAPSAAPATGQNQFYKATADDLRASKLIGSSVKNDAGDTIGDINEVILGKDGKVAAIIIGAGGFLGMGEREIAVSFNSLKLAADTNGKTVVTLPGATKDSLKAAPEWKWTNKS